MHAPIFEGGREGRVAFQRVVRRVTGVSVPKRTARSLVLYFSGIGSGGGRRQRLRAVPARRRVRVSCLGYSSLASCLAAARVLSCAIDRSMRVSPTEPTWGLQGVGTLNTV